eukprot:TRINITY_DN7683_c0_g1_i1.p1 TRINITY_DN7683_c0_g1~~TRINITY_DN7683_c0_g1_i1.p1  ORF type:complete len:311 (+),score=42.71 TRINITY_DN7683_c0_g1_i1:63-935(+)
MTDTALNSPVQRRKSQVSLVILVKEDVEGEEEIKNIPEKEKGSVRFNEEHEVKMITPATHPNRQGQFGSLFPKNELAHFKQGDKVEYTLSGTNLRTGKRFQGVIIGLHEENSAHVDVLTPEGDIEVIPWYRVKHLTEKKTMFWGTVVLQLLVLLVIWVGSGGLDKHPSYPGQVTVTLHGNETARTHGFTLGTDWIVNFVQPNSSASRSGLRCGFQLTTINGHLPSSSMLDHIYPVTTVLVLAPPRGSDSPVYLFAFATALFCVTFITLSYIRPGPELMQHAGTARDDYIV